VILDIGKRRPWSYESLRFLFQTANSVFGHFKPLEASVKHVIVQGTRLLLIMGIGAAGLILCSPFLMTPMRSAALSGIVILSAFAGWLYDRITQRTSAGRIPIILRLTPTIFAVGIFFANNGALAPLVLGLGCYYLGEIALHAGRPWLFSDS
jgi:hypothetical protein